MRIRTLVLLPLLTLGACAYMKAAPPGRDAVAARSGKLAAEKAKAREAASHAEALERRAARLELELWERDAMIEDLDARLEAARRDVVRAMAKLRTLATRAEAASAMAEADVALQSLSHMGRDAQETKQVRELMQQSTAEFAKQNYGGALYLANQAKTLLARAPRLGGENRSGTRAGENVFLVPVHLQATGSGQVRDGPGAGFKVSFTVKEGMPLTGRSYSGDWVRVSNSSGREGWIPVSRLARRTEPAH
jgi:uncharacterized coiled-coil protein SlyX